MIEIWRTYEKTEEKNQMYYILLDYYFPYKYHTYSFFGSGKISFCSRVAKEFCFGEKNPLSDTALVRV